MTLPNINYNNTPNRNNLSIRDKHIINIKGIINRYDCSKEEMHRAITLLLKELDNQDKTINYLKKRVSNANNYNFNSDCDLDNINIDIDNINININKFNFVNNLQCKKILLLIMKEHIKKLENYIINIKNKSSQGENKCCVCLTEVANQANINCGHLSVCETCSYQLGDKCPICRTEGRYIKIFKS